MDDSMEQPGSPRNDDVLERVSGEGSSDEQNPEPERGVTKRPPSSRQSKHLQQARRAKSEKRLLMEKLYAEHMAPKPPPKATGAVTKPKRARAHKPAAPPVEEVEEPKATDQFQFVIY